MIPELLQHDGPVSRLIFMSIVCLSLSTQAQGNNLPLESMDPDTFERTGLSKLSPEQLAELEAWIVDYVETSKSASDAAGNVPALEPVAVIEIRPEPAPVAEEIQAAATEPDTQKYISVDRLEREQKRKADRTPDLIRSRIKGEFKGWRGGRTRFLLENGDVWQQRQTATFTTSLDSPEVIIRKKTFGYAMEVPAINKTVLVKKVN